MILSFLVQSFSGDSWDKCSTLILNIRNAAYKEGKIRDKAWMAELASIHFTGEALAWYAGLPEDVQEDWSKLQVALANQWSTPKAFSGDSWDECSTLIRKVRHAAWREGKIQDQAWMANFASIHFLGEALAWYARLPRDVQEDWSKLQAALANRWSTLDAATSEDTPASEDVTATDGKSDSFACGLIKAVENGSGTAFYVQGKKNVSQFGLTQDVKQAARFRFESQSTPTLLENVSAEGYQWLAIHWQVNNPNVGQGSSNYGYFSVVAPETMKSSWDSSNPFQIVKFRFLSSGEVVPVWRNGKMETDMAACGGGSNIYLTPDAGAFLRAYTGWSRLTLSIEKIEE